MDLLYNNYLEKPNPKLNKVKEQPLSLLWFIMLKILKL